MSKMRTCSKCKITKPDHDFSSVTNYWCRDCRRDAANAQYAAKKGYDIENVNARKKQQWAKQNVPQEIIDKIEYAKLLVEQNRKRYVSAV